jgi:hypothetical protein
MTPEQPTFLCIGTVSKPDDSGNGSIKADSPLVKGELAITAGANTARSVIDKAHDGQNIGLFYELEQELNTLEQRASKKQMHAQPDGLLAILEASVCVKPGHAGRLYRELTEAKQ